MLQKPLPMQVRDAQPDIPEYMSNRNKYESNVRSPDGDELLSDAESLMRSMNYQSSDAVCSCYSQARDAAVDGRPMYVPVQTAPLFTL